MSDNNLFKSYNPKNLLVGLYHYHHNHAHQKNSKKEPIPRQYNELDKFRQKIEEEGTGPHHRPYQAGRKQALIYQTLFFSIGLLFLLITIFMYTQTMNWSGSLFFVNYTATKTVLCLLAFALSMLSFGLAYSITVEKEATNQLTNNAQKKLRQILSYKRAEFGMNSFSFGNSYKKNTLAKEAFHDAYEKIKESRKITFALLEHITHDRSLNREQVEKLFNEAILELNDKLHTILYDFKREISKILDTKGKEE